MTLGLPAGASHDNAPSPLQPAPQQQQQEQQRPSTKLAIAIHNRPKWRTHIVGLDWVEQSVERRVRLIEAHFEPPLCSAEEAAAVTAAAVAQAQQHADISLGSARQPGTSSGRKHARSTPESESFDGVAAVNASNRPALTKLQCNVRLESHQNNQAAAKVLLPLLLSNCSQCEHTLGNLTAITILRYQHGPMCQTFIYLSDSSPDAFCYSSLESSDIHFSIVLPVWTDVPIYKLRECQMSWYLLLLPLESSDTHFNMVLPAWTDVSN